MKGLASIPTFLWMKRGLTASARQSLGCSPAQPIPAGFDDSFSKALLNSGRSHFEHRRHLFCSSTRKWSRHLSRQGWVAEPPWKTGSCHRIAQDVHRGGRWGKPGSQVWVSPRRSFCQFIYIQDGNVNVHILFDVRLLSLCTSRFTDFTGLKKKKKKSAPPRPKSLKKFMCLLTLLAD